MGVGAYRDDNNTLTSQFPGPSSDSSGIRTDVGAAYIFKKNGTTWVQEGYLKSQTTLTDNSNQFAEEVKISNSVIAASSHQEDSTVANSGSVEIYR